jgi:hypothetical protein
MFNVALSMELQLLPLGRREEGDHPKDAQTDTLHNALNYAAFAGSISSFENGDNADDSLLFQWNYRTALLEL